MARFRIPHRRRRGLVLLQDAQGSALLEFAITLPLLVVFVVGIYDFSGAFNQKQKIEQAAQEGAIIAGAQPMSDIASSSAPPTQPLCNRWSPQFSIRWPAAECCQMRIMRDLPGRPVHHSDRLASPGRTPFPGVTAVIRRQSGHRHQPRMGIRVRTAGSTLRPSAPAYRYISISLAIQ